MPIALANRPDPILCKDQLAALQDMHRAMGTPAFCALMFWILPKNPVILPGRVRPLVMIPFQFNLTQRILFSRISHRNLVLKARQMGLTVWFLLVRLLLPVITTPGKNGLLISHRNANAEKTFRIAHRALRWVAAVNPENPDANELCESLKANVLHTAYSNRRELVFDQLDSTLSIGSAEVSEEGQSLTIHHFVADEYSRWPGNPEETLSNIKGALVPGATEDIPCTANGAGDHFHREVMRAINDPKASPYVFHFFEWWKCEDYYETLSEKEKDELEKDLTADELAIIRLMHKQLRVVAR